MTQRYSVGWSDYQGVYGGADPSKFFVYRIEPMGWGIFPPRFQRYRIMCGTVEIGNNMTKAEAEAMKKLLEVSNE